MRNIVTRLGLLITFLSNLLLQISVAGGFTGPKKRF